jgi:hypothetical protein
MQRVVAAVAAGSMLLFAAGCGDEHKEFRMEKLAPLQQAVKDQRARIAATLQGLQMGDKQRAAELEAAVQRLAAIHDVIEDLDPPDDVEGLFETYLKANQRLDDHLARYAALVKAGKREGLKREGKAAQTATGDSDLARVDVDLALTGRK